ncbi:hypothetical protein V9T40_013616 [Parthenolecanium corni]|uniref:Uncharacterized protein n=1 Tax=Parthenolecanium corni TaxID=536013 RepID=A0AAN9TBB7_9HEMI
MNFSFRFFTRKYRGKISTTAVMNPSTPTNWEPVPSSMIMKKNKIAHADDQGICVIAFGYAMNTNPGPDSATCAIGTPCSFAI